MTATNINNSESFDEMILQAQMNNKDKALVELAQIMFTAYNGSYKPHIVQMPSGQQSYIIKHTEHGYSLIFIDNERGHHEWVCATTERLDEFIPVIFLILGKASVKRADILKSDAVLRAIRKRYNNDNLQVAYYEHHPHSGDCLVCSENINGSWQDGYYNFGHTGNLHRITQSR